MAHPVPWRMARATLFAITAVVVASSSGCGGSSPESLLPVEGQVRLGGKPLPKGSVVLYPDKTKGNSTKHEPRADIDAQGHYRVFTHPNEGAPPGWYKVAVIATEMTDPKNPYSLPRSLIPEKFGNPEQSQLFLGVKKDALPGAYDLDLK